MRHASLFAYADRVIDRFQPTRALAPGQVLPFRFLAGGALLGLGVAVCALATSLVAGQWGSALVILAFGVGLVATLAGLRRGVELDRLARACVVLLGTFFVAASLTSPDMEWTQLRWLALLPMAALFLSEGQPHGTGLGRPIGMLAFSTLLALLLGIVIVVVKLAWAARLGQQVGVDGVAAVDFALFLGSVAGLLWVQHLALSRAREELAMLRSMLAVCAWCRRIRDSDDGWVAMEHYMLRHTASALTHGICPDCSRDVFAENDVTM